MELGGIWSRASWWWMDIENLIESYGYVAVLVGTFLEGETIVVLSAFAAHQGYLPLLEVIFAAFIRSLAGGSTFTSGGNIAVFC